MLIVQKIAKKIALLLSRSLNFIPRSFDLMAIADRDLDREKMIAIDDQKIADHSYLDERTIKRLHLGYQVLQDFFKCITKVEL